MKWQKGGFVLGLSVAASSVMAVPVDLSGENLRQNLIDTQSTRGELLKYDQRTPGDTVHALPELTVNSNTHVVALQGNDPDYLSLPGIEIRGVWTGANNMGVWEYMLYLDRDSTLNLTDTSVPRKSVMSMAIPEPGTLALLGIGLVGLTAARRRQVKMKS